MSENVIEKLLRTRSIENISVTKKGIISIRFKRLKQHHGNHYQQRPKPHDYSENQTKLNSVIENCENEKQKVKQ